MPNPLNLAEVAALLREAAETCWPDDNAGLPKRMLAVNLTEAAAALDAIAATPWSERVARAETASAGYFNPDGSKATTRDRLTHALRAAFPEYAPTETPANDR